MWSANLATTTFNVYRAFGGALQSSANACRLVEQMDEGRRPETSNLSWSHYIEFDMSVDVRDGVTRTAGTNSLSYADGDEIRIPDASGTIYVVVFVIVLGMGSPRAYKRAYLLRDTANFTGTGWS